MHSVLESFFQQIRLCYNNVRCSGVKIRKLDADTIHPVGKHTKVKEALSLLSTARIALLLHAVIISKGGVPYA